MFDGQGHPVHFVDETGIPYGIKHVDNKPRVTTSSFEHDIGLGDVADHTHIRKFGRNTAVGNTLETVWGGGGLYPWPAGAEILKVSSSDVNDDGDPESTGAFNIQLFGCDASYVLQDETITLNGQTAVATTKSYLRIHRAIVRDAGASGWNEGTISVKDNADAVTLLTIEPFKNQTLMAIYTIPAGSTGHLLSWYAATSANLVAVPELYIRPFGEVFQVKATVEINQEPYKDAWEVPDTITEKSDIEMRATVSGGGGAVSGGFTLWHATT